MRTLYLQREMTMRLAARIASIALIAALSAAAEAAPLTWTLEGVTSLGTSITGSFVYDADTNAFGTIDVTTTGGSIIPSETWANKATFGTFNGYLALVDTSAPDETGANLLNLIFDSRPLSDAGGIVPLTSTQQGICASSNCVSFTPYAGDPSNGLNVAVTGVLAAVPEPDVLALFLAGLAVVGGLARKRVRCDN